MRLMLEILVCNGCKADDSRDLVNYNLRERQSYTHAWVHIYESSVPDRASLPVVQNDSEQIANPSHLI